MGHPFLFLFFLSSTAFSQFDFNVKEVQEAYKNILKLKVDIAKTQLKALNDTSKFESNGIVPLLENYLDIIPLLTNEDKALYKKLKVNENIRLKKIKALSSKSPYFLYSQADIKLQWAFVELLYEDYFNGFLNLKKANDLINNNITKYPNFKINNKVKGLIELLTEAAPEEASFALRAAGLEKANTGVEKLTSTAQSQTFFKTEIDIYLSFVSTYIKNDAEGALWKIDKCYKDHKDNLFALFTYVNVLSQLKMHHNIITLLNESNIYHSKEYLRIPYLDYVKGESLLFIQEYTAGITSLRGFLNQSKKSGSFNAYTCFKLALTYSALNKRDSVAYFLKVIRNFPKNQLYLDKYAHHFVDNKMMLETRLSKSRLYFEGGYYQECYDLLKNVNDYRSAVLNVEKYFRLASSAKVLGKVNESIPFFEKTIKFSSLNDASYFAPYACLQLGYHYQSIGNNSKAISYYKKAKLYSRHFYVTSVREKADEKINSFAK